MLQSLWKTEWSFLKKLKIGLPYVGLPYGPVWRRAWQLAPVFLAWRIPWTEELGGLQSIGSQRVRHDWNDLAHIWSSNLTFGYLSKRIENEILKRYWPSYVHCSIICNRQDMSFDRWMNQENMVYMHSGILFSLKKEENPVIGCNMNETWGHYMPSEVSQSQKDKHCINPFLEVSKVVRLKETK